MNPIVPPTSLWRRTFVALAALGLLLLCLSPYLTNGFWSDDCLNSTVPGWTLTHGEGVGALILWSWRNWLASGRLFPLANILVYGGYGLIQPLETFRLYQIILVLANIALFTRLVRAVGGSRALAGLSALLLLVNFQVRLYHDPIGSFGGMLQWVLLFLQGTLLCYEKSFRAASWRRWLAGACVCYAAALLSYEVALGALVLIPFMEPVSATRRERWRARAPVLALWGVHLAATLALRAWAPTTYDGTQPGKLSQVPLAAFKQASGVVPFLYFYFQGVGSEFSGWDLLRATWGRGDNLLLMGPLAFAFWRTLRSLARESVERTAWWRAGGLAWALVLYPSALIGLSARYQKELAWGLSYLPVYISYFGAAWIAASLAAFAMRAARRRSVRVEFALAAVLSALGTGGVLANRTLNLQLARQLNEVYLYPRQLVEEAAATGVFDELRPDDLLITPPIQWLVPDFMVMTRMQSRGFAMRFLPTYRAEALASASAATPVTGRVYFLEMQARDGDVRWLRLSRLARGAESTLRVQDCDFPIESSTLFMRARRDATLDFSGGIRHSFSFAQATPTAGMENGLRRLYDGAPARFQEWKSSEPRRLPCGPRLR